jgi:DNA-binding transcriptional regulator/RsmH inhibitor MraZ
MEYLPYFMYARNTYKRGAFPSIYSTIMEEILSVDEQGRVDLPAHIRKAMGIRG